ncbi:MAG: hypothetical protein ACXAD7_24705, partial [Candidatus Kariarchaeaceae archaeon]
MSFENEELTLLDTSVSIEVTGSFAFIQDDKEFNIEILISLPTIIQNNSLYYPNVTKIAVELDAYNELITLDNRNLIVDTLTCANATFCTFEQQYQKNHKTDRELILSKTIFEVTYQIPDIDYQENIKFEEKAYISYISTKATLIFSLIIIIVLIFLLLFTYYPRTFIFPKVFEDQEFKLIYLIDNYVRRRLILKTGLLFLLYGTIFYEHNPQYFHRGHWSQFDMLFFSSNRNIFFEFSFLIIIYLFSELIYFMLEYWKDVDLKQYIRFI